MSPATCVRVRYHSLDHLEPLFLPYPLDGAIVPKFACGEKMFPVLLRVLENGIPKHRNWISMTVLRFSPLFLIAEIESNDVSSDAGAVYNPSSVRPSPSFLVHPRLHFIKTIIGTGHAYRAAPSSIRSKTKRVFINPNGCAPSLSSILNANPKKRSPLTHAMSPITARSKTGFRFDLGDKGRVIVLFFRGILDGGG